MNKNRFLNYRNIEINVLFFFFINIFVTGNNYFIVYSLEKITSAHWTNRFFSVNYSHLYTYLWYMYNEKQDTIFRYGRSVDVISTIFVRLTATRCNLHVTFILRSSHYRGKRHGYLSRVAIQVILVVVSRSVDGFSKREMR